MLQPFEKKNFFSIQKRSSEEKKTKAFATKKNASNF